MKMYRLTQKKFVDTPFNPMGAKLFGGRWNSKGIEALYFAESESLCVLEVFISPRDRNYVVNPNHPLMPEIFNKAEKLDFSFDQRIFK
ncbi:RES domain protein [Vibrio cholerae]|nr:RES domain protein [Vibrio cholerae]